MVEKIKKNQGITIISLVITIIVLLILAGVSLSLVFNQNGIFKKAEQTTDKYGQAKARETLEMVLSEARMQKYESGLTDEELTEKINTIGRELEKEDETSSKQKIIVEGYIFEIDRSTPKFVKYIGPADGIVITSSTTQNGNWQNLVATVTGEIKIYGDGKVVSSSARVTSGSYEITGFPTTGGTFTLENITEDVDIEITATDNKERTVTKVIEVRLVRDNTAPTLSETKAEIQTNAMQINISAKAEDDISGVKEIRYSVNPETITPNKGTLSSGEEVLLTAKAEGKYTITFIAEDNAGNPSDETTIEVEAYNGVIKHINTKEGLKAVNTKAIYGAEVTGYDCSVEGMEWQIFYIDEEDENRVYLISKNYVTLPASAEGLTEVNTGIYYFNSKVLSKYDKSIETTPFLTKFMHGLYTGKKLYEDDDALKECCYLLDQDKWKDYMSLSGKSTYAFGAPTGKLFISSFNDVKPNGVRLAHSSGGGSKHSIRLSSGASTEYSASTKATPETQRGIFTVSAGRTLVACPRSDSNAMIKSEELYQINADGYIGPDDVRNSGYAFRLRPVVSLEPDIILTKINDLTYTIET